MDACFLHCDWSIYLKRKKTNFSKVVISICMSFYAEGICVNFYDFFMLKGFCVNFYDFFMLKGFCVNFYDFFMLKGFCVNFYDFFMLKGFCVIQGVSEKRNPTTI